MIDTVVASACRSTGLDRSQVLSAAPVGGGCINEALRLRTTAGTFFLKWNAQAGHSLFQAEAEGLEALARSGAVTTPSVVARSRKDESVGWLLLEWIEPGRADAAAWARLGRELASLHRWQSEETADRGEGSEQRGGRYGWRSDNVIGSLPQPNRSTPGWGDFWAEFRILPLARELRDRDTLSAGQLAVIEKAAARAEQFLDPTARADGPSLLHGDLWSGNVLFGTKGRAVDGSVPVLIDPAVYVGHREVDLAMCRLFGGFAPAFYRGYDEAWPLLPGHGRRRSLYQLYPLLVHARLFGGGYVESALEAAEATLVAGRQLRTGR